MPKRRRPASRPNSSLEEHDLNRLLADFHNSARAAIEVNLNHQEGLRALFEAPQADRAPAPRLRPTRSRTAGAWLHKVTERARAQLRRIPVHLQLSRPHESDEDDVLVVTLTPAAMDMPRSSRRSPSSARCRTWLIGAAAASLIATATAIVLLGLSALLGSFAERGTKVTDPGTKVTDPGTKVWLRADAGIPDQYHNAIIRAGTWCDIDGLSPALIAAMLKAESNFDPGLKDPGKDEYGIARWTPSTLMAYLPEGERNTARARQVAMIPDRAIPAMGQLMCTWGKQVKDVPGDPALKLAAVYRTSTDVVRRENGIPPALDSYMNTVRHYLAAYRA
ncbi:hypothetical protein [Nonomuraea typhae]|uniref:hypothetical protein n=1 Tax=Nonomuraea typhae TaxID=2603600 RepID=UPI0012FCC70B|nr:hypothetical protein [Nonomuraea typhae]